jgi:hypothetical protein
MPEVTEFPSGGITYSDQAFEALEHSPWLVDDIAEAMVQLMTDLMDIEAGRPVGGIAAESLMHLKNFAAGDPLIGLKFNRAEIAVGRLPQGGWQIRFIKVRIGGLN